MKTAVILSILAVFVFGCATTANSRATEKAKSARALSSSAFPIFDAIGGYKSGQPNLIQDYGMLPIHMLYSGQLWGPAPAGNVGSWPTSTYSPTDQDRQRIQNAVAVIAQTYPNDVLCIDIENWPLIGSNASVNLNHYLQVITWIRQASQNMSIGLYATIPILNYNVVSGSNNSPSFQAWAQANAGLQVLGHAVDILFPSLYTYENIPQNWMSFATATLQAAHQYNKLVYPFIWPEFHDGTPLAGQFISQGFWAQQLAFIKNNADGVVIWGPSRNSQGQSIAWDSSWGWWAATCPFLPNPAGASCP